MSIIIEKAGWQTLVMDQGRKFTRHLGIPVSGVTDLFRYWWANGLVGHSNFKNSGPPVLEIRSGPVEIIFETAHRFALTGAGGEFSLDGVRIQSHKTWQASPNQILRIGSIDRNGTVYLAIGGQWNVDRVYESASADVLSPFPGTCGQMIKNNTRLEIIPGEKWSDQIKDSPEYIKPTSPAIENILRMTAGPELERIEAPKKSLIDEPFVISRTSNRMAYRLETEKRPDFNQSSMISSAVLPGTLQWPVGGQPILLLPNCQTTGGYPRIGRVIDADYWKLAYLGPGDSIRFKWVSRDEALYLRQYQMGQFTQAWNRTFDLPITHHLLMY